MIKNNGTGLNFVLIFYKTVCQSKSQNLSAPLIDPDRTSSVFCFYELRKTKDFNSDQNVLELLLFQLH